jgi:hypothetical protein
MVIAGRIQRYIFMRCITSLAMTLGIIVLAIVLVDVVEQMRTVGSRTQITIQTAFTLTMMKTPGLILETLPFAMLIGAILTYSQLSRRSELPAIRASGVSAWRFLGPVMVLAVVLGTIMVTVLDPLATRLNEDFEATRDRLTGGGRPSAQGVWLSQGDLQAGAATGEAESPATPSSPLQRGQKQLPPTPTRRPSSTAGPSSAAARRWRTSPSGSSAPAPLGPRTANSPTGSTQSAPN